VEKSVKDSNQISLRLYHFLKSELPKKGWVKDFLPDSKPRNKIKRFGFTHFIFSE
jgi:hypothetical protein